MDQALDGSDQEMLSVIQGCCLPFFTASNLARNAAALPIALRREDDDPIEISSVLFRFSCAAKRRCRRDETDGFGIFEFLL
mmetsp:Transcript_18657/g.20981  ORF Transcript_18657/g.20981 Transcript_18657/m.20981 type:complete len:81 (-) Transcript_18657:424-666(-)